MARQAVIKAVGDRAFKRHSPHWPAFADQNGGGQRAHAAQGCNRIGGAARDMKFFFGADDQVEQMQAALQLCADGIGGDKAVFAVAMAGEDHRLGR